ncbi:hypothetical protein KP509_28G044700 [Ceratopteris richardii]|nr:hypothetical protein KP509_28G044700 [Ceratopteris richardii]
MRTNGINPNTYTYQSLLRGCIKMKSIESGRKVHCEIAEDGFECHPFVGCALVDMYAKFSIVGEAQEVFNELPGHDVVSWTALIGGYAEHGHTEQALKCLFQMQAEGIAPNSMTFVCSLKGCTNLESMHEGLWLHSKITEESLEGDIFIGNTLVDMYVKQSLFEDALEVFRMMPNRDVITWTALIMGYGERGFGEEALLSLNQMRKEGVPPNDVTYLCSVKACSGSGSVDTGFEVHDQAFKEGFDQLTTIGNALVDMYAKCGSLLEAWDTFRRLHVRDIISWSALIAGYAHKGESKAAFHLFDAMKSEGIKPDSMVLLGVLNACNHSGLVLKGKDIFDTMEQVYGISPNVEHYNCMLDLIGRSGQLVDAMKWLEDMPFKPNFISWSTLLSACQKWSNVEFGKRAFDCAVKLDKSEISSYIIMSSIFLDAGMHEEAKKIDVMRANIPKLRIGEKVINMVQVVPDFSCIEKKDVFK